MKKVGIMGGTFDPIHIGHLRMAEEALRQFDLDEVLFMPSKNPPHKKNQKLVSEEDRSSMIKLAIKDFPYFQFSDIELCRDGTTYTADTIRILIEDNPDTKYYFVLGGDSLKSIEQWYRPEIIFKYSVILACNRGTMSNKKMEHLIEKLNKKYKADIRKIDMSTMDVSSRMIRKRIKHDEQWQSLCPHDTAEYICAYHLYGSNKQTDLWEPLVCQDIFMKQIEVEMTHKRYIHTLGVIQTATGLAFRYGYNVDQARLAAALHDIAKYKTPDQQIALCEEMNLEVSDFEKKNPFLIHGKAGSVIAAKRFGVTDSDILSAICFHTTGRPGMTLLEKIIYIADYIEPGRHMDCQPYSLADIRKMVFLDLDKGLVMCIENTLTYLEEAHKEIDDISQRTFYYYLEEGKREEE